MLSILRWREGSQSLHYPPVHIGCCVIDRRFVVLMTLFFTLRMLLTSFMHLRQMASAISLVTLMSEAL